MINQVGIKDFISSSPSLASDLTGSLSGLYLEDVSPKILSTMRLEQLFPNFEQMGFDDWVSSDYTVGDKRIYNNYSYICINNNSDPEFNPDNWETLFSFKLRELKQRAFNNLKSDFTTKRNLLYNVQEVKAGTFLFNARTKAVRTSKTGQFNCIKITPSTENVIEISKVGVIVTQAQTLTYYVYHSDKIRAKETREIEFTEEDVLNGFVWKAIEPIKIQNAGVENTGGQYLFGFFEGDLIGDLVTWDYSYNYHNPYWLKYSGSFGVYPVKLDPIGTSLPDIGEYFDGYSSDGEIAFNLGIKTYENFNYLLDDYASSFASVYQYRLALDVAKYLLGNERKNTSVSVTDIENFIYGVKDITAGTEGKFKELSRRGLESQYEEKLKEALENLTGILPDNRGLIS